MIRITKGDITLECETQADVKLALGVFADVDVPELPKVTVPETNLEEYRRVAGLAPDWRVGGPVDPPLTHPPPVHVPVTACNLEALEAVMRFSEGVPTRGLQELLGLSQTTVSGRLGKLQKVGLIERVPHRNLWRATSLARRAKLVRS